MISDPKRKRDDDMERALEVAKKTERNATKLQRLLLALAGFLRVLAEISESESILCVAADDLEKAATKVARDWQNEFEPVVTGGLFEQSVLQGLLLQARISSKNITSLLEEVARLSGDELGQEVQKAARTAERLLTPEPTPPTEALRPIKVRR